MTRKRINLRNYADMKSLLYFNSVGSSLKNLLRLTFPDKTKIACPQASVRWHRNGRFRASRNFSAPSALLFTSVYLQAFQVKFTSFAANSVHFAAGRYTKSQLQTRRRRRYVEPRTRFNRSELEAYQVFVEAMCNV